MYRLAFAQTVSGYVNRDLIPIVILDQQVSVTFRDFFGVAALVM